MRMIQIDINKPTNCDDCPFCVDYDCIIHERVTHEYYDSLQEQYQYCPIIGQTQGWISCDERLPDKNGDYLVTFKMLSFRLVEACTFTDGQWDKFGYEKVLAWQPLPEAYRGET